MSDAPAAAPAAAPEKKPSMTDNLFGRIIDFFADKISHFVSFLFILLGVGVLIGRFVVTQHPGIELFLLAGPFVFALLSYYSRTFAIIAFVAFILLFIL